MTRLVLRLVIGCFIAVVLWWVGPLLALGVYKPLGWALLRQVLVALVLLWALWPILVRVFARISLSRKRIHPISKASAEMQAPLSRRLRDLDEYLWQRQLAHRPGRWAAWAARSAAYRNLTPRFAVVGASSSGKTTMIRRGGVALKGSADLLGRNGDEEGPTVDCNFWHAGDAIWFDTNGRWVEPGGEGASGTVAAWSDFLDGLRKTKRQSALDGILLCVDSDWVLRTSVEGRKRAADGIRARLTDMARQLELRLPVWVALTGLDKVQGAVRFLSSLDEAMLERGIGFSRSIESGDVLGDLAESLEDGLRKVEQGVQEHVLRTAPSSPDLNVSFERLVFVENLSKLSRHLTDFLVRSMADATVEDHCRLRGVWMGSSVDLIDGQDPSLLEFDAAAADASAYGVRRLSMLWGTVFRQMTREKGLAMPLAARSARRRLGYATWWGVGISALASVIGVLTWGYIQERNHVERVWAEFTESKRLAERQAVESRPAAALMDAMTQMRYIDYNLQSASELVVAPYWEHARVAKVAGETYRRHLRKSLMPELYNYVTSTLIAQTQGAPGDTYGTLKVYLMLSRPERRSADELVGWMATQWPKLTTEGYSDEERQAYEGHLRSLFVAKEIPGTPEDAQLVQQARTKATQVPSVARVIQRIKASGLPSRMEDVSLASAGGYMAATTLRMRSDLAPTDAAIPAWYTRAGYHDAFKPRLQQVAMAVLEDESWVLRDERLAASAFEIERAAEKLADAARTQFLQEYITRWQAFLNDVTVRRYSGMADAAQLASSFIDPQSPLAQFIRFAARETSLTENYAGDVDGWIEKQKYNLERSRRAIVGELSGERERFKLLPEHVVDDHFESIRRLGAQLVETLSTGNGSNPFVRLFEPLYRQLSLVNGTLLTRADPLGIRCVCTLASRGGQAARAAAGHRPGSREQREQRGSRRGTSVHQPERGGCHPDVLQSGAQCQVSDEAKLADRSGRSGFRAPLRAARFAGCSFQGEPHGVRGYLHVAVEGQAR